ncbi:MAG: M50 family metallopeptidase [Chloroflexota bacterium]|nr:M50 family metallopeptidase [Chloroflexota bacterium]
MLTESPNFRRGAFIAALVSFAVAFALWNIPQLGFLMYPFRLFVTFVHESGHGLAAILTGGRLEGFLVNADGSGLARTVGGSLAVILPAGYIGAACFGAGLFYLTNTVQHTRVIAVVLGVLLLIVTLLYTGIFSLAGVVGIIGGLLLIALGWRGPRWLNLLVLNVLALLTALHSILDLIFLINNTSASAMGVRNDAAAFSAAITPLVPPVLWAVLWAAIALVVVGLAFYFSIVHPLVKRE